MASGDQQGDCRSGHGKAASGQPNVHGIFGIDTLRAHRRQRNLHSPWATRRPDRKPWRLANRCSKCVCRTRNIPLPNGACGRSRWRALKLLVPRARAILDGPKRRGAGKAGSTNIWPTISLYRDDGYTMERMMHLVGESLVARAVSASRLSHWRVGRRPPSPVSHCG